VTYPRYKFMCGCEEPVTEKSRTHTKARICKKHKARLDCKIYICCDCDKIFESAQKGGYVVRCPECRYPAKAKRNREHLKSKKPIYAKREALERRTDCKFYGACLSWASKRPRKKVKCNRKDCYAYLPGEPISSLEFMNRERCMI